MGIKRIWRLWFRSCYFWRFVCVQFFFLGIMTSSSFLWPPARIENAGKRVELEKYTEKEWKTGKDPFHQKFQPQLRKRRRNQGKTTPKLRVFTKEKLYKLLISFNTKMCRTIRRVKKVQNLSLQCCYICQSLWFLSFSLLLFLVDQKRDVFTGLASPSSDSPR